MKDKKITRKITQGVYVLTTDGGGCIVDAVSQVSAGDNPLISVTDAIGYMTCEIVDSIDTGTHTLFIGRLIGCDKYNDNKPMSYDYYQEHKDELLNVKTESGKNAWVCTVCGYVYYGDKLPEDFKCPKCGVDASLFELK